MSSILRALKKLEAESTSPDGQRDEKQIKMRQVVTSQRATIDTKRKALLIVVPLMLIAAWFILKPGAPAPVKERTPIPPTTAPPKAVKPQTEPAKKMRPTQEKATAANVAQDKLEQTNAKQVPSTSARDGRGGLTDAQKERLAIRKSMAEQDSNRPPVPASLRDGRAKGGLNRYIPPASGRGPMPIRDGRSGRAGQDGKNVSFNNQATTPIPGTKKSSHHPQFKLEGILWSQIPARRIVLIADKYLKEGNKIRGATILKIEKKSVTFQSGSDTWTVHLK